MMTTCKDCKTVTGVEGASHEVYNIKFCPEHAKMIEEHPKLVDEIKHLSMKLAASQAEVEGLKLSLRIARRVLDDKKAQAKWLTEALSSLGVNSIGDLRRGGTKAEGGVA